MGKPLARNTTVGGDTYAAGTTPPDDVAKLIDNPKAYLDPAEDAPYLEVDEPEDDDAANVDEPTKPPAKKTAAKKTAAKKTAAKKTADSSD